MKLPSAARAIDVILIPDAATITVAPAARRAASRRFSRPALTGSSPEVGSSRNNTSGSCSVARAKLSRMAMPLEYAATG